jgi:hypothetical protein
VSRLRAWYGTPDRPVIAEVVFDKPPSPACEYRAAQDALEAEIARLGIVGVPLDFRGKPLLTGIEAAA